MKIFDTLKYYSSLSTISVIDIALQNVSNFQVIKWFDYLWMSQKNCEQDKSINCLPGSHKLIIKSHQIFILKIKWRYCISCCPESFYSGEKDVRKCFPNSYLEAWVSLSGVCRFCDTRFRAHPASSISKPTHSTPSFSFFRHLNTF